jgi:predicted component of type VI protein secretion system
MPPGDGGGCPGDLRITPAELRAAATAIDAVGSDVDGQAGKLDGLFIRAAGAAGNPRLADSAGRAAWDFAGFARALAAEVAAEAGKLRAAATCYEHADATGAARLTDTPAGAPGPSPAPAPAPTPGGPR